MTALLIVLALILLGIVTVQIGRITDLAGSLRNPVEAEEEGNRFQSGMGLFFVAFFLIATFASYFYYSQSFFGYAGNMGASEHAALLDWQFNVTLVTTVIVFVITHILLFYFAYKYKGKKGRKALYMPHDNRLEIIWTSIPAVVMTFLVVNGLVAWNSVTADVPDTAQPGKDYIEVEATGMQFAWLLRFPGKDNLLGTKYFTNITGKNPLGQDWRDVKNHDDFQPDELVLPVGKTVRVRITARDVLHNFYLPQFRLKMDAVPGMPTYFVFKPIKTTEEYRADLKKLPEWQELNANGVPRWKAFDFELACAEMCGQGHFSMRRVVKIVTPAEYEKWVSQQKSFYLTGIKGTEDDTYGKSSTIETHPEGHSDATPKESNSHI